jgi:hypothetical protein
MTAANATTIHTVVKMLSLLVLVFMFNLFEFFVLFYLRAHWFAQNTLWCVMGRHFDGSTHSNFTHVRVPFAGFKRFTGRPFGSVIQRTR